MNRIQAITANQIAESNALVLRVFRSQIAQTYTSDGIALFEQNSPKENLIGFHRGDIFLVALNAEQIIGVVRMNQNGHLHLLFIDSECQNTGVGRKLLNSAAQELKISHPGASRITLNATKFARPIYTHWGFTETGSTFDRQGMRAIPMAADIDAVIM